MSGISDSAALVGVGSKEGQGGLSRASCLHPAGLCGTQTPAKGMASTQGEVD